MMRSKKRRALRAAAADPALRLVAGLRALADAADASPKWNQLFPMGTFHNGGWPAEGVTIDKAFCDAIVANWKKRGEPELAVDYFHKTNDEEAPNDQRHASGWMSSLEARDDGLWAKIKWTDKARAAILADELRYLSPEFHPNGIDAHTGQRQGPTLVCAGLLTNPAFKEMPRVAANEAPPPEAPNPAVPEQIMNREQITALLKTAGITLAANATEAEVQAALTKYVGDTAKASLEAANLLKAKEKTDADTATALKASQDAETALKAQLAEANADKAKLGVRVANIEKQRLDEAVNALCARALDERRIAAAGQESVKALAAASGLEAATNFVNSFAKGTIAASGTEKGHGEEGDVDATEQTEVKVKAAELVKAGVKGSAAIRAASMASPTMVKKLSAVPTATAPQS